MLSLFLILVVIRQLSYINDFFRSLCADTVTLNFANEVINRYLHHMKSIVELWTPVLLNDGIFKDNYLVSNMGRVKKKRVYKDGSYQYVLIRVSDSDRPSAIMYGGGKRYRKSVAKLVLSSFHWRKNCECVQITYLDGNMRNCRLSNLRYKVDRQVYTDAQLEKKPDRKPVRQTKPVKQIKSCKTCINCPCFSGMENLTSDFGAMGCRSYKPKEELTEQ